MDTNELMYNFMALPIEERTGFLTAAQRKISVELTNEVMNRLELFLPLTLAVIVPNDDAIKNAFLIWETYWRNESSGYSSYAYFTLFVIEMAYRQDEEKKFAAELEAM
jgi:hypothetical protein